MGESIGFPELISHCPLPGHRLFEILNRFLKLVEHEMDHAEAVECLGFAGSVSSNSPKRERLIEIVERFLVLTKLIVRMSSVVQQRCLEARIKGFLKREAQGIGIQCFLLLVQTEVD